MPKTFIIFCISVAYIFGIFTFYSNSMLLYSTLFMFFLLIFYKKLKLNSSYFFIIYLFFTIGIFNTFVKTVASDELYSLAPLNNVKLEGQILSIPKKNFKNKTKFYFKVNNLKFNEKQYDNVDSKTIVSIVGEKIDFKNLKIGNYLEIKGNLRTPLKATNPSQFDYSKYLKFNNTFTTFYSDDKSYEYIGSPKSLYWEFLQGLDGYRENIMQVHSKYLVSPNLDILGGVVFGNEAINPPDDIKQTFVSSGLLHLLAASGLNVALICTIWFFITNLLRFNYRFSVISSMFLILFYVCMTGFPPSVVRAAIMLEFILFGKLMDRKANSIALIAFVAMLMLIVSPSMIFDVGFQLSFLVTFGLILCVEPLVSKIKFIPAWLSGCLIVPLVAQIWVLPLQMFYFNTFTPYSFFANICVLPFITAISFLGFSSSILAGISFIPLKIIFVFDFISKYFLDALVIISKFFASIHNSIIYTFQPNIFQIILYYSAVILLIFLIKSEKFSKKLFIIFCFIVFLLISSLVKIPNKNLEIITFDVKNADCFLIKTPENKYLMLDTGKAPFSNISQMKMIVGEYLKDKSIKKVDYLILTHFDSDHAGGALDLLDNFEVKEVFLGKGTHNSRLSKSIIELIEKKKIKYSYPDSGTIIYKENNLKIYSYFDKNAENDNEKSLINLIEYGTYKALFMGDAGIIAYKDLEKYLPKDVNLLKLGHHGAKNVINEKMLNKINPKSVIISTGQNRYNHPDYRTVNLLKTKNIHILRTDLDNAVKITLEQNRKLLKEKIYYYDTQNKKFEPMHFY